VLPDVLRDLGVDPTTVFDAAGLDIRAFSEPEGLVPLIDFTRLIQVSVQASGRQDLGVPVADRAGARAIGLLGRLMDSAGDLRAALHDLVRYGHLSYRGFVATLATADGAANLDFALGGPLEDAATVVEDAILGVVVSVIRSFLGSAWRPSAVMFFHAPVAGATSYRQFFGAPVRFDAVRTAIEFPAADLDRAPVGRVSAGRGDAEASVRAAAAQLAIGFEEEVVWFIRAHLSEPGLSIEQVAASTGISRRSVNRRLATRGFTFARLLRSVRFAAARQLMVDSDTPLSEVAAAIGYAEPSVFSRTFRDWSGLSPREWRRRHGRNAEFPQPPPPPPSRPSTDTQDTDPT
jgi:AraC-like DNA-binding protein